MSVPNFLAFLWQRGAALALPLCWCAAAVAGPDKPDALVVNGRAIDARTIRALEQTYRTQLKPGRYWYDVRSGLWGYEGGPSAGQIAPGIKLGGPLSPQASGGRTKIFFNGRALHPDELARLQQIFGPLRPARYWLDANGVGGVEGGPAQFDLVAAARARGGGGGSSYTRRGPGGNTGSDGRCSYYNDPSTGASVMTGDC